MDANVFSPFIGGMGRVNIWDPCDVFVDVILMILRYILTIIFGRYSCVNAA